MMFLLDTSTPGRAEDWQVLTSMTSRLERIGLRSNSDGVGRSRDGETVIRLAGVTVLPNHTSLSLR